MDTSALTWRYVSGNATKAIDGYMAVAPTTVISEWVLVEWSSGLARECREGHISYADFKANEVALMTDIAHGQILVLPTTRAAERVRALIEYVGARLKYGLKAGDATQIVTAMESTARFGKLHFICCDKQLATIMTKVEPMASIFDTTYVQP